ncbi:MAG: cytochrome P450 [Gemmatimonadota bacterium]
MPDFKPFSEAYLDDPYAYFERYGAEAPVFYDPELDHWVVSRYDDIKKILKDSETFSNRTTLDPVHPFSPEVIRILHEGGYKARPTMVGVDAPLHTRGRKFMNLAFTPRRVSELEPKIRGLVNERLGRLAPAGRMDLVESLTYELPALALFSMLGVPDEDVAIVKTGAQHRLLLIWGRPDPEEQAELARGLVAFWQHTERLVERRLRDPGDDLTSELIRLRAGDDSIVSLEEIASLIFGLLFAGHETTTAFITNAVRRLLDDGDAWRAVAANPGSLPAVVEELLRADTSGIVWRRLATRDAAVGGVAIPSGSRVLILLGSANHDESKFKCPHQLDFDRPNVKDHLSFGFGIHYCLGASLARLETRVVLECLATRLPSLRLAADRKLEFLPNLSFRGPRELWVEWGESPV